MAILPHTYQSNQFHRVQEITPPTMPHNCQKDGMTLTKSSNKLKNSAVIELTI